MAIQARFCIQCGQTLDQVLQEERLRAQCPACGWTYYPQLKVCAAVWVEQQGAVMLLRRSQDPFRESWYLPAGYVEADEDPQAAAVREAMEETGLKVQLLGLREAVFFDDDPRGCGLLLVYTAEIVGGFLTLSKEVNEADFFAPTRLPDHLCGAGHEPVLRSWAKSNAT